MIAVTSDKVEILRANLYTKQAALREALDTTGNSCLDAASILAINTSPVQTLAGPAKTASTSAAPAMTEPVSAIPYQTTCSNSILTITPTLAKLKAAAYIPAAANKAIRFTQDAANKEGDERKDEVPVQLPLTKLMMIPKDPTPPLLKLWRTKRSLRKMSRTIKKLSMRIKMLSWNTPR